MFGFTSWCCIITKLATVVSPYWKTSVLIGTNFEQGTPLNDGRYLFAEKSIMAYHIRQRTGTVWLESISVFNILFFDNIGEYFCLTEIELKHCQINRQPNQ